MFLYFVGNARYLGCDVTADRDFKFPEEIIDKARKKVNGVKVNFLMNSTVFTSWEGMHLTIMLCLSTLLLFFSFAYPTST